MGKLAKIWFVLFFISYLPFFYIPWVSVFGMEITFFFSSEFIVGFDAAFFAIAYGCFIPVYPIILLFQCIFGFFNRKKFTKKLKKITVGIVLFLVGVTVFGEIGHLLRKNYVIHKNYEKDSVAIAKYLKETFGEDIVSGMVIQIPKKVSNQYLVSTPLLQSKFSAWMEDNGEVSCDFESRYIKEQELSDKMGQELSYRWGMPAHTNISAIVEDIDIKGYQRKDLPQAALVKCSYRINGMYMEYDKYDMQEVIKDIKIFFLQYKTNGNKIKENSSFQFYVRIEGEYYASIQGLPMSEDMNEWKLLFRGYNDKNGLTIEEETVNVNLLGDRENPAFVHFN